MSETGGVEKQLEISESSEVEKQSQMSENSEVEKQPQNTNPEDDPYAYLDRGQFSSENFKIIITNMPKYYGISELKKLLNTKLNLNTNKIKTLSKNCSYAFVCFKNEEDRANGIKKLSKFKWKGKELHADVAKPSADPLVKKRKEESDQNRPNKKVKNDHLPEKERIKQSTIPLSDIDYTEQLKIKQNEVKNILKKLGDKLASQNIVLKKWIESQQAKFDGLSCELLDIRFSDEIDGYRNKCEFTVGISEETEKPTVGSRIGAYVNGITSVATIDHLKHIPESMKVAVKLFQDFVTSSELKVYNPESQTGHFRQLSARTAENQLMLIVGVHPQDLSLEEIEKLKNELVQYFSEGKGKEAKVTSLYYQKIVKKISGEDPAPADHLWGDTHIFETILGLKFRVSPEAFFQVNTKAAEILYKSAIELAQPNEDSTVLDVCCGTGTIGLCFAKKCSKVFGIEIVPQAIIDAQENARLNEIENSNFFAGKAEEILGSVCYKDENGSDFLAVVDPPRAGLHQKAIFQLRKIKKINRLVYISCNPNLALKNFVDLGRPESKTLHGEPFVPVKAVAVDLFPHTKHCELVVLFKRWDQVEKELNAEKNE